MTRRLKIIRQNYGETEETRLSLRGALRLRGAESRGSPQPMTRVAPSNPESWGALCTPRKWRVGRALLRYSGELDVAGVYMNAVQLPATLITSNLPFDEWTSVFGSERLTGAFLDRLTHHGLHLLRRPSNPICLSELPLITSPGGDFR